LINSTSVWDNLLEITILVTNIFIINTLKSTPK